MQGMVQIYFYGLKIAVLMSLIRSYVKFDQLQKQATFLAVFYALSIGFLSYVFLVMPQKPLLWTRGWELNLVRKLLPASQSAPALISWRAWQFWILETFLLMRLYLKLLSRFDEGGVFWLILAIGLFVLIPF